MAVPDSNRRSKSSSINDDNDLSPDDDEQEQESVKLISLDQTYICFDVDSISNAIQELILTRSPGAQTPVAWRIRTNAPTRYIVNPARGLLQDATPVQIVIELIGNRFHPNHKLTVQAVAIVDGQNEQTIWKHKNLKNMNKVQTIHLKLSTMLMNLESTHHADQEAKSQKSIDSLKSLMSQSSTVGLERVHELESLKSMLQSDIEQIRNNIEQTKRLQRILDKALDKRKLNLLDLKQRVMECEQHTKKIGEDLARKEAELQTAQVIQTPMGANCTIS